MAPDFQITNLEEHWERGFKEISSGIRRHAM